MMRVTVSLQRSHCSGWSSCGQGAAGESYKIVAPNGTLISQGTTDSHGFFFFDARANVEALPSWKVLIENRELPEVLSHIRPEQLAAVTERQALARLDKAQCLNPTTVHACDPIRDFVDQFPNGPDVTAVRAVLLEAEPKLLFLRATAAWPSVDQARCVAAESVRACDSVQNFVRNFPTAPEAATARALLDQMEPKMAPLREADAWAAVDKGRCLAAETSSACEAVKAFLSAYPKGGHSNDANALLGRAEPKVRLARKAEEAQAAKLRKQAEDCHVTDQMWPTMSGEILRVTEDAATSHRTLSVSVDPSHWRCGQREIDILVRDKGWSAADAAQGCREMNQGFLGILGRYYLCHRPDVDTVKIVTPQGAAVKQVTR